MATFTTSSLAVGSYSITAVYEGNGVLFQGSTSSAISQSVIIASTTTTVSSDSSPLAVAGQPVTFTAQVTTTTSGASTPTGGTVVFFDGDSAIGASTLSDGVATFTTSSLSFGLHSITAVYEGNDSLFQGSTSSTIGQFITSAGTGTTLTVEAVRNRNGKIVEAELVADVSVTSPGAGTPSGNVVFFVNGRAFYRVAPLVDGTATLSLDPRRLQNKIVYARFLGYYNIFQPSASTSQFVSRRSLGAAIPVTESASRAMAAAASPLAIHHPIKVVKVHHTSSHRRQS